MFVANVCVFSPYLDSSLSSFFGTDNHLPVFPLMCVVVSELRLCKPYTIKGLFPLLEWLRKFKFITLQVCV